MHPYATDSQERRLVPFFLAALSIGLALLLVRVLETADITPPWWLDVPSVMGFYGLLYAAFDQWLWRWRPLQQLGLVQVPDLRGDWAGYVTSSFEEHAAQVAVRVHIQQTWTHLLLILETESSTSRSLVGVVLTREREPALSYEYFNEPRAKAVATLHPHRGTARLRLSRTSTKEVLDGEYYTGRGRLNYGGIHLEHRCI